MISKAWTMAAAAVLLAAGTWVAAGQEAERPHRRGPGPGFGRGFGPGGPGLGLGRLAEELGLTEEQKARLEALRSQRREAVEPLLKSAREAHEAFRAALEAENPDALAVGEAALAMKAAEAKVKAAHDAGFEEMKSVLTPEQAARLEELRPRGPRRGPRGPRP